MHPLDAHELEVKLFAEGPEPREFVPIFHEWIQIDRIAGELLIDVADYSHVHHGPGVVLVGERADYLIDQGEGRLGLVHRRKRKGEGEPPARLRQVFQAAFRAGRLLEEEPALRGRLRFRTDEMRFRIRNHRLAPNREDTFEALAPVMGAFLRELCPDADAVHIDALPHSKEPFGIRIAIEGAPDLGALVSGLGE